LGTNDVKMVGIVVENIKPTHVVDTVSTGFSGEAFVATPA